MWFPTKLDEYKQRLYLESYDITHKPSFRGVHVVLQLFVKVRITNRNSYYLSKAYIFLHGYTTIIGAASIYCREVDSS